MSFLLSSLRNKCIGLFAITGSYYSWRYFHNSYKFQQHLFEARRLSAYNRNKNNKTLIITDTTSYDHKLFKKYAEPILKESSTDFILVSSNSFNFENIIDYIVKFPSCNVIVSGNDKYINHIINKIYITDPVFLNNLTLGLIPLNNDSELYTRLGVSQKSAIKISLATLICLKGLPVDFHPLIIESSKNNQEIKTLSLNSVKIGKLGYYHYLLATNDNYYFGPLKYFIYFNQAARLNNSESEVSFNYMDKDKRSLKSSGFSIDVEHFMLSPLKLRYISNESLLSFMTGYLSVYRYPFEVSEFVPANHRGIVFNIDGREVFVYSDGMCIARDFHKFKVYQSETPLFKINTFYEFQKGTTIKESLSIAQCLKM